MATTPQAARGPARRLSRRGRVIFIIAAVAVIAAAVVGIRGLLASPIESVAANGTAVLHGSCACSGAAARAGTRVIPATGG